MLVAMAPSVEPYSIDEMFVDFSGIEGAPAFATRLRAAVLRATKIPMSVGIGPTKTIAKLANRIAKADRTGPGIS
ncbi:Y-family DNA polymerase, partial [Streptomyces galilaeus]